ncbi:MAG TPA: VOC family protein [Candidatus Limnocylindria bacterium]|nr:VOC family protein [Candidatus Limnocylindria bacterium]
MPLQVSAIMIGVKDIARSKKFYADLGCEIEQDYPQFVKFKLGDGSSSLALYEREAAAQDAGVRPRDPDSGASRSTSSCRRRKRWTRS